MASKFDIRKFAKEHVQDQPKRVTWIEKVIAADPVVGWQIIDLLQEWLSGGPIRKDYPTKEAISRLICKIDCVTAEMQSVRKLITEVERGQKNLPSQ
jgi:hypothetical protein